jgi:hypothetical protein
MRKNNWSIGLGVVFLFWVSHTVAGPVPDTGQKECYDNVGVIDCPAPGEPFYGQDAHYDTNPFSYTRLQFFNNPNRYTKLDILGHVLSDNLDHSPSLSWPEHNMTQDSITGLMWTHSYYNSYRLPPFKGNWASAQSYCDDLIVGDYSDWRLPDSNELAGLAVYDDEIPILNTAFFRDLPLDSASYWTSSETGENNELAYRINFKEAPLRVAAADKETTAFARCVRNGQVPLWAMVRDNVTGLTWESKYHNREGLSFEQNYDDPHDADNTYTWYDSGNLLNPGDSGFGKNTEIFLATLNQGFGGYTDWRLPTIKELFYLVDLSIPRYSITSNTYLRTDYRFFPHRSPYSPFNYWSSTIPTHPTIISGVALPMDWAGPYIVWGNMKDAYYAMAVRGDPEPEAVERFVNHGNDTVTDKYTGLMWQKTPSEYGLNWEQALHYSENLSLGGFQDWRLPNIKELLSIVDFSRIRPAINTDFFNHPSPDTTISERFFWSSTTTFVAKEAYGINFYNGDFSAKNKTYGNILFYVRAVRTAQGAIPGDINGDEALNLADAVLCLRTLVGLPGSDVSIDADVDGDGRIGLPEAIFVLQWLAGMRD